MKKIINGKIRDTAQMLHVYTHETGAMRTQPTWEFIWNYHDDGCQLWQQAGEYFLVNNKRDYMDLATFEQAVQWLESINADVEYIAPYFLDAIEVAR